MHEHDLGGVPLLVVGATAVFRWAARNRFGLVGPLSVAAVVAGRLSLTWACRRGVPAARGTGLGALVAGTVHPAIPVLLTAAALAAAGAFRLIAGVAMAAGLAASLALTALCVRRLGGITGDVLGAQVEITTAVCLLVTAIS